MRQQVAQQRMFSEAVSENVSELLQCDRALDSRYLEELAASNRAEATPLWQALMPTPDPKH